MTEKEQAVIQLEVDDSDKTSADEKEKSNAPGYMMLIFVMLVQLIFIAGWAFEVGRFADESLWIVVSPLLALPVLVLGGFVAITVTSLVIALISYIWRGAKGERD